MPAGALGTLENGFMTRQEAGPPPKPSGFDPEVLFGGVHWHQQWEVYQDVFTPGRNPVCDLMAYAGVPQDLSGKTVLDIGAWNGCFSFECIRRGASRVLGLGPDDPVTSGFFRLKEALGHQNADYVKGSVYDLDKGLIGEFDIVLFFGVLYHLRYPLLALDKIFTVCKERLFAESFVIDNHFLLGVRKNLRQLAEVAPELVETPLWEFFQFDEVNEDGSNWFGPNLCALTAAVESAGFDVTHSSTWGHRAALAATRTGEPQFLTMNSYENDEVVAGSVGLRQE